MDRRTHRRFLTYLETWTYFHQPGEQRLDVETWKALDAELEALLREHEDGILGEDEARRIRQLERLLLRD